MVTRNSDGKIRLGLVGLKFGAYLAERDIFSRIGGGDYIRVVSVCDLCREVAVNYANKYNLNVHDNIAAMLSDPEIEAVGLFTPPENRAQLIRECIRAGKHVMTTKPFELDATEALSVLKDAENSEIIVHLNSPAPTPSLDLAKINEWRDTYCLGRPIAARWETYSRYHEEVNGSWLDDPARCPVAPIFRLGIYGINELLSILGEVETAQVTKARIFTGRPTPDNAELSLLFKNGAIGSVFSSLCIGDGCSYSSSLTVHFENGTIIKKQIQNTPRERRADFKSVEMRVNCLIGGKYLEDIYEFSPEERSGAYQWKYFHDVIRGGKVFDGQVKPEMVAMGIAVIQAMAQAEKSGKAERVIQF